MSVEPVLTVDVIPRVSGSLCGIRVGDAVLPVLYRNRSEALRIAERLVSLLQDGYGVHWEAFLEQEARFGPHDHSVERLPPPRDPGFGPTRAELVAMPREGLQALSRAEHAAVHSRSGACVGGHLRSCVCGHLRSQHSGDRAEDFRCLALYCGCNGWNPR